MLNVKLTISTTGIALVVIESNNVRTPSSPATHRRLRRPPESESVLKIPCPTRPLRVEAAINAM